MSQANPRDVPPSGPTASAAADADEPDDEALSADDIFHLLQTNRRRDALRYLREHDGPVQMRDLAEQVAAWEHDTTVQALASVQRQRVYIPLYQTHLPKLDDVGVIEYDQSRGIVERTPKAAQLDPYIDGVTGAGAGDGGVAGPVDGGETQLDGPAGHGRDWDGYYTGTLGFGVALLGGSFLGLPVLSTLSGIVIGAFVSLLFGTLTIARLVERSLVAPVE